MLESMEEMYYQPGVDDIVPIPTKIAIIIGIIALVLITCIA